ncbi:MAG TPA: M48 family metallopeptidase [Burkholderiaceae bacterium]|nr:M48 family metallopeptidase [Burkholderiaceae bacterium]
MQATTPAQPSPLLAKLAKPTPAYKRRAWLAMAGLALFVALYFALAGWFLLTAYRLTIGADAAAKSAFWGWIVGACAAFLAVFMLKAVFFVKHGGADDGIEITPAQQPELFRFLHHLADKAGAPRPHKVFVSPRVNAAVFYDLSLLNLILPSRKNLEIGLGLVNALTLGEFRAVLAHEFGHFAQRAMAVGRWVYMAQQIAAQLVARRDKLDDFLGALSRLDPRVAWVGWILRLVVWSIRSLVESAFQVVVLMQRALSREMELNADLVAVSLTGSDALIHALHRLNAADDAWARAVGFVMGEKAKGRGTRDLFAIQTQLVSHMGQLLNDADYGRVPAASGTDPAAHRVFRAELAQAPQMWLTHPLNHEREANAKRHYVQAAIDERSAWTLFADAQALREQVTTRLLGSDAPAAVTPEESLQSLNKQFEREFFHRRYRGVYFGRSIVRCAAELPALCDTVSAPAAADFDSLYPRALAGDMERLRTVEKELAQLRALRSGALRPPGGVIRHRDRTLKRTQLPSAIASVERELAELQERLQAHDRRCRGLHRAAAASFGEGWSEYLQGLLAALHYADHTESNLRDLQGMLANTVAIATATRRVNSAGIERIVQSGNALRNALATVFAQAGEVQLDATLLTRLAVASWREALGDLGLPGVDKGNVGEWLKAVDGWVDHAANACSALRTHALEQLLLSEAAIADHVRQGTRPAEAAPAPTRLPARYDTLVAGAERERQTRLDFWGRFQTADGIVPAGARLLVAGGIVTAVLGLGGTVGSASVTVYNGLALPVSVKIGTVSTLHVAPFATATQDVDPGSMLKIETRSAKGELIESFDADVRGSFGQFVYNVAGAAPLVEWTAVYGNATARPERLLGAPRWTHSDADTLFAEAPKSISTKGGGGTRDVLTGLGSEAPQQQLGVLATDGERQRLIATHARWDGLDSPYAGHWLGLAMGSPQNKAILAARLAESPDNVLLRRLEQDSAGSADQHDAVCARHQAGAAAAPQNVNLQYVATRCLNDGPAKDRAFLDGHRQHPEHAWFAYAAGYVEAENMRWEPALAAYELVRRKLPPLVETVNVDTARIRRMQSGDRGAAVTDLEKGSESLRQMLALESGQGVTTPAYRAYPELARGNVERAVQLAHDKPQSEARLLRLAAASDGAGAALVAKVLALPLDQGLDDSTVWASLALAARARQGLDGYLAAARHAAPDKADAMLRFVDALKNGASPQEAELLLDGLAPELRGHACSMGTIMLGAKAPRAWRDAAKRLLFASERPYFS